MKNLDFDITDEIKDSLKNNKPIVALESTLISHGLPYPKNLEVAKASINAVRSGGSVPATIAIIKGRVKIVNAKQNITHRQKPRARAGNTPGRVQAARRAHPQSEKNTCH